jgi:hypothetical protein
MKTPTPTPIRKLQGNNRANSLGGVMASERQAKGSKLKRINN